MGKRARTTARKPRGTIPGDTGKPVVDIFATGSAGNDSDAGNSGAVDGSIIDPAIVGKYASGDTDSGSETSLDSGTGSDTGTGKRKYTRRKKTEDAVSLSLGSFKDLLYSSHAMMHTITQSVLFDIDEDEAAKLAQAVANVTRHYDIPTMAQKTVDWIMLIQTAGATYGPRLMAIRMDRAMRNMKPTPQSPMAPRNVGPSPSAPGPQPKRTMPPDNIMSDLPRGQPMPSANDKMPPAQQQQPGQAPSPRRQPGLDGLDGAGLPLKLN